MSSNINAAQTLVALPLDTALGLVLLIALASAAAAYLGSYLQQVGRQRAIEEGFEKVLEQGRQTTEVTERIRKDISHEDWSERERKTLLRAKLEDLLLCSFELREWLDQVRKGVIYKNDYAAPTQPDRRLTMLASLYFPDIKGEVRSFVAAVDTTTVKLLAAGVRRYEVPIEQMAEWKKGTHLEFMEGYQEVLKAMGRLEILAAELMAAYIGEPTEADKAVADAVSLRRERIRIHEQADKEAPRASATTGQ